MADQSAQQRWIAEVVGSYERRLVSYAVRLLHGDVERARDVVQDTFLKLWQTERDEVEAHVGAWLYRVCRNRAVDVLRKEQRMTLLENPIEAVAPAEQLRDGERADDGRQRMLAMLNDLPTRQQEILWLKFQGDLSYKQIAEVMQITVNNVGVLIHTALRTLRERSTMPTATTVNQGIHP